MAMKDARKSANRTTATGTTAGKFSDEERAAIRERGREVKATARRGSRAAVGDEEGEVLAKLAEMPEPDRSMGQRLHAVIRASVPDLAPRLWYGMPAYAKDGKIVCYFQGAHKFKSRYATLGFSDRAKLDEEAMWPSSYALAELTPAAEARIGELVKRAVS